MLPPGDFQLSSYVWVQFINQGQVGNVWHLLAKIIGVELLFTRPNGFPKRLVFHHFRFYSWSSFCHLLVSSYNDSTHLLSLRCRAGDFGLNTPSWPSCSFLPHILLIHTVQMWICLLNFPTQSLQVSFLPWALLNTASGGRAGFHGQNWDVEFGKMSNPMRMWGHACQVRASLQDTCLKVISKPGYQADREGTNLRSRSFGPQKWGIPGKEELGWSSKDAHPSMLGGKTRCSALQWSGHGHEASNQRRLGLKARKSIFWGEWLWAPSQGMRLQFTCWRTRDPVGPGTEPSTGENKAALTAKA